VQQTAAGLQPIDVELGTRVDRASMLQEPATHGPELDPGPIMRAVGLDEAAVHPELAPQVVGTGIEQLIVPLGDPDALDRARPDATALRELLGEAGCVCAYLAVPEPERQRARSRSFFVDDAGAVEDPATGSAAGPLMAYLHARAGVERLTIEQGAAMGRPSELRCEAGERVRVGGDAVVVIQGRIDI
jgi:trans-2,3-dihydro-3-hydroxyanthranilate isomerase